MSAVQGIIEILFIVVPILIIRWLLPDATNRNS